MIAAIEATAAAQVGERDDHLDDVVEDDARGVSGVRHPWKYQLSGLGIGCVSK